MSAARSLYQFPRVIFRMFSKLKDNENSINFIIVGGKILWVEQTESHWRMMGLKGRNEVCERSFRTLTALHQWFCARKQNSRALLLPALSLIFSKLPDFLLTKCAAVLFCACGMHCRHSWERPCSQATEQHVQPDIQLKHMWNQFLRSQASHVPTCYISCPFDTWWLMPISERQIL